MPLNPLYPALMLLAVGLCAWMLRRTQAQLPLTPVEKFGLGLGAFCGAMIGAKLPFVLASDWSRVASGFAWLEDGKTIMTGIVGGYFGVELAKWSLDIRIKTGDTFAAPVAVAVAIGRLACFSAGCCYGTPTNLPWGVYFPKTDGAALVARHPTQLYEFVFHLVAAGLLFDWQRRGMFRGQLIKIYILAYLAYRFISEFIRPEARMWAGLTGYQWAALVLAPLFLWLYWRDANQAAAAHIATASTSPAHSSTGE